MNFYGRQKPRVDELVMVVISEIDDSTTKVKLLEYNDIEAYIMAREVSRKMNKKVERLMKIGKEEVMKVLRISGNYVDLTKKDLTEDEIKLKLDEYSKLKKIYNMINYVAETFNADFEKLLSEIMWPQYNEDSEDEDEQGITISIVERILTSLNLENIKKFEFTEEVESAFIKQVLLKFPQTKFKLELLLDITCYSEHGIDGIKNAIRASKSENIDIQLVSSPTYRITTESLNLNEAEERISEFKNKICKEISKWGGNCSIRKDVQVSTA